MRRRAGGGGRSARREAGKAPPRRKCVHLNASPVYCIMVWWGRHACPCVRSRERERREGARGTCHSFGGTVCVCWVSLRTSLVVARRSTTKMGFASLGGLVPLRSAYRKLYPLPHEKLVIAPPLGCQLPPTWSRQRTRPRLVADHTHKEPCTKTAGRGPVPFYPSPSREVSVFIYLFIYSPRDKVFLSAATYGCHQRAVTKSGQRCVPLARARSLPFLGLLSQLKRPPLLPWSFLYLRRHYSCFSCGT